MANVSCHCRKIGLIGSNCAPVAQKSRERRHGQAELNLFHLTLISFLASSFYHHTTHALNIIRKEVGRSETPMTGAQTELGCTSQIVLPDSDHKYRPEPSFQISANGIGHELTDVTVSRKDQPASNILHKV